MCFHYLKVTLFIYSEKLAALKARKERIREIQSQLLRPSPKPMQMDEAYLKAQEQLKFESYHCLIILFKVQVFNKADFSRRSRYISFINNSS